MLWCEDSIPKAIQLSKNRKCIFLVYIFGEDELSQKMDETWANETVSQTCQDFVAVKIKSPSDVCQQFAQIYPVVVVPSTFFIGLNGVPIEVTPGHLEPAEFKKKVEEVMKNYESQQSGPPAEVTAEPMVVSPSPVVPEQTEQSLSAPSPSTSEQDVHNATPIVPSDQAVAAAVSNAENADNLENRVEYAKQKIQENRDERAVKTEEKDKDKELDRRKLGKGVQKLRRHKAEKTIKEMQDEIKKQKEEDRQARQRVKDEIDRDRAERKAKYEREKEGREMLAKELKERNMKEKQTASVEREASRREISRLQFRLPDGSAITNQFKSSEPLSAACSFVSQHLNCNVQLHTVFPKRTFTSQDMSSSLLSLDLVPSAVILVIPQKTVVARTAESSTSFLNMFLAPLFVLWNFVYGLIFGGHPDNSGAGGGGGTNKRPLDETDRRGSSTSGSNRPSTAYKRRSPISRQEGNIHKFTNNQDDDDDQSTWNGNSTQQM